MTDYQKCKQFAKRMDADFETSKVHKRVWHAIVRFEPDYYVLVSGATRSNACARLWHILLNEFAWWEDER